MRKFTILLLATISLFNIKVSAKSFEVELLQYSTHGKNVSVRATEDEKDVLRNVIIPQEVSYNGERFTVNEIESNGFKNCKRLESITIPNSVTKIGMDAFVNCVNLKSAIVPDNAKVDISIGFYGMTNMAGPFSGCHNLTHIQGNNGKLPQYALARLLKNCKDIPFLKNYNGEKKADAYNFVQSGDSHESSPGFKEFAKEYIEPKLNQWQARKGYETTDQWHSRVNQQSRDKKISALTAEAQKNYVATYSPKQLFGILDSYDSDYSIYTINTTLGQIYAQVPAYQVTDFERNWRNVKIDPVYGVRDNKLAVTDCYFTMGKEVFRSPEIYRTNNLDNYDFEFQSLEAYFADESANVGSTKSPAVRQRQMRGVNDIVDTDIPITKSENDHTFAIIIGNENYVRSVPNVDFAANDAEVFAQYCQKTLGLPENNIRKYINATYGDIISALSNIEDISKAFKGNIKVIFYYAGHGMPDDSSMAAYILPVDSDGTTTEGTFSLDKLYERLGKMKSRGVIVFLDACFSGAGRADEMLAEQRAVRIKPKDSKLVGNMIVMSAASGKQTALPYKAKGHGMFTYFLLDKLRKSKGNVSVAELFEHVLENVSQQSVVINSKPQIPTLSSSSPNSDWENTKLR